MDKTAIKTYAVWARNELIARVTQKAEQYEITEKKTTPAEADSIGGRLLSEAEKKQRAALIEKIKTDGFEQVMEEVAYTWFNRFTALRFMEVNNYLPSHTRVFTNEAGEFKPQILTDAIQLDLEGLNMDKVFELKDANKTEELYKYLLITQCNALSSVLPRMFQKIAHYTELLLPDYLLREGSVIEQMIALIPEEDWTDQVQIIGWLYQYYNSEPKDAVFAALKKNVKISKENIPAATQLFTPDWIVRYMVENSLGKLWLQNHDSDFLRNSWKYYITDKSDNADSPSIRSPEEIRCIDPCVGSGHILSYVFDVLMQIYQDFGYSSKDAVYSIIKNNIWGIDIDARAAQLAYFSIMMKARQYDRRFFGRNIQPHIYTIMESNSIRKETIDAYCGQEKSIQESISTLMKELRDAKEYGSIIKASKQNWDALYDRFELIAKEVDLFSLQAQLELLPLVQVAELLSQKYHICVTNPPYLNFRSMNSRLLDFCADNYPNTKADLFGVFIEVAYNLCVSKGYFALITMQNWMHIDSFNEFRTKFLSNIEFINLLHLGMKAFDSGDVGTIVKTVAFVMQKAIARNKNAIFFDLRGEDSSEAKDKRLLEILATNAYESKDVYYNYPSDFLKVPNGPITYAFNKNIFDLFSEKKFVEDYGKALCGIQTGDNSRFLRLWFEVEVNKIALDINNREEYIRSNKKWASQIKGGFFRKWYGNLDYIINIYNDGYEISHASGTNFRLRDPANYFLECLTWSHTSDRFGVRFLPAGNLCNVEAPAYFLNKSNDKYKILAFLNSKVAEWILAQMDDSLHFSVTDVLGLPYVDIDIDEDRVKECIKIAKEDWDSYETSWDFARDPLTKRKGLISEAFEQWKGICENRFKTIKENEEYFNARYIQAFGLEEHLDSAVDNKNISISIPSKEEAVRNLISYAVGCMFGRYSIDVDGLIFAGGSFDMSKYSTFKADKDNIIPICDDEYFNDDIVTLFAYFIARVFGDKDLEENLAYIAGALGGNGSSREIIREYFLNGFYKDHCSKYSVSGSGKRPIYWLFDSGKKNAFQCLIYMHRYKPDTIARIRTDYVHEQQSRYRTALDELENRAASATTGDRVKLNKQIKKIKEQSKEIRLYEEKIHHLADQMIVLDLDDGMKVNYSKLQEVLAKIK